MPFHRIEETVLKQNVRIIQNFFFNYSTESRAEKLWIPSDSPYLTNKAWLDKNFPRNIRSQLAIFTSDKNVLDPKVLLHVSVSLHSRVIQGLEDPNTKVPLMMKIGNKIFHQIPYIE